MRKFLLITILSFLFITNTYSQYSKSELPTFYIENGDTLGVLISVEQLQKIDNKLELLSQLELLGVKCDSLETFYIKVIDNLKEKNRIQAQMLVNKEQSELIFKSEIDKLKKVILLEQEKHEITKSQLTLTESQLLKAEEKSELWKKESRSNNKKKWSLLGTTVLFSITTFILSIAVVK